MKNLFLAVLFLSISVLIPLVFENALVFLVTNLKLGWVFSSVILRLLVIVLFSISLFQFFKLNEKLSRLKFWLVLLIGLLPGFGVSFIAPIYVTDYGMLGDDLELKDLNELELAAGSPVLSAENYTLVAFFTTTCPHCQAASARIGYNIKGGQTVPVTAIFPGSEGDTHQFLEENNGKEFNALLINNDDLFLRISNGTFPSIFLVDKSGKTLNHWVGDELNYTGLDYLKSLEQ